MSQPRVAQRQPVPRGVAPFASASLTGVLQQRPYPGSLAPRGTPFCEAVVEVGDVDIVVRAKGDLANIMCRIDAGTAIRVDGQLVRHVWTTAGNGPRERTLVDCQNVGIVAVRDGDRVNREMQ